MFVALGEAEPTYQRHGALFRCDVHFRQFEAHNRHAVGRAVVTHPVEERLYICEIGWNADQHHRDFTGICRPDPIGGSDCQFDGGLPRARLVHVAQQDDLLGAGEVPRPLNHGAPAIANANHDAERRILVKSVRGGEPRRHYAARRSGAVHDSRVGHVRSTNGVFVRRSGSPPARPGAGGERGYIVSPGVRLASGINSVSSAGERPP